MTLALARGESPVDTPLANGSRTLRPDSSYLHALEFLFSGQGSARIEQTTLKSPLLIESKSPDRTL